MLYVICFRVCFASPPVEQQLLPLALLFSFVILGLICFSADLLKPEELLFGYVGDGSEYLDY